MVHITISKGAYNVLGYSKVAVQNSLGPKRERGQNSFLGSRRDASFMTGAELLGTVEEGAEFLGRHIWVYNWRARKN